MLNTNNVLITGGCYVGNSTWDNDASNADQCFKIYQITEGEIFLHSKNNKYKLEKGNIYFINGFQLKKQCCPDSFRVNWIHFLSDSIFIKQILRKLPLVTKLTLPELKNYKPVFKTFSYFFEKSPVRQKSINSKYISDYFKIQSLISLIAGNLFENPDTTKNDFPDIDNRLFQAVRYINNNYKSNITLKILAGLSYMSENYFHSLFKKEFKITPNNYILQLRMNEALNLLINTQLSIKEIAGETGFFDAAYFSRTFSKYYELSPKQYRNSNGQRVP